MTTANALAFLERDDASSDRGAWVGLGREHSDPRRLRNSWSHGLTSNYDRELDRALAGHLEQSELRWASLASVLTSAAVRAFPPTGLGSALEIALLAASEGLTQLFLDDGSRRLAERRARRLLAIARTLARQPDDVIQAVEAGIVEAANATMTDDIWGPAPGLAEVGAASVRNQRRLAARRDAAIAMSLTLAQTATLTGKSEDELVVSTRERQLLAFEHGGTVWIPLWQLSQGAPFTIRREVSEIVARFQDDAITTTHWMLRPNVNLDGSTPLAALIDGRAAELLRAIPPVPGG